MQSPPVPVDNPQPLFLDSNQQQYQHYYVAPMQSSFPSAPTYYTPNPAEHYPQQGTQVIFPVGNSQMGQMMYVPQGMYPHPQQNYYGAPQSIPLCYPHPPYPEVFCGRPNIPSQDYPSYAPIPSQYVYASDENAAPGVAVSGYGIPHGHGYKGGNEFSANSSMNGKRDLKLKRNVTPPPGMPLQTLNGPQTGCRSNVLPQTQRESRPISSTPLPPADLTSIPPPLANQTPGPDHMKNAYLNYRRHMDEDILANLSRISVADNDDLDNSRSFIATPRRENVVLPSLPTTPQQPISAVRNGGHRRSLPHSATPYNHTHNQQSNSYKTRACAIYTKGGACPMGLQCRFAHGTEEIRPPNLTRAVLNPKYKTRLCKNYFTGSKVCPYGARCEFIHEDDAEYAEHATVQERKEKEYRERNLDTSANPSDVTPVSLPTMPLPPNVTQSSEHPNPRSNGQLPRRLGNREWAQSMVCLSSVGRTNGGDDERSTFGAISSSVSHANLNRAESLRNINKASAPSAAPTASPFVPLKFMRRRSMSQLSLNKNLSFERRPTND